MHDGTHNFVITLISDTILLLTVLVGLFRLNRGIRGSIGVGRLLWNQVRLFCFASWALDPTIGFITASKGVIWLLLAAAVEIPPVVRLLTLQLSSC